MTTTIFKETISSLLQGLPVDKTRIQNALFFASVALDRAKVNNQPTDQIEADRADLLWLISKI